MQSIRLCLDHKTRSNDEPKLYLQVKLNYFQPKFLDDSKIRDLQKLFNWLDYKSKNIRYIRIPKGASIKRLVNKAKLREVQCLIHFSRSNFGKELNGYVYGYPSKLDLMQMQTQLRTCSGERYLLVKVIESIDGKGQKIRKDDCQSVDKRMKKNEIIVSLSFMTSIFKNLKQNAQMNEASDDNFIIELSGYRFRIFLIIIYTFYTNQLYLNLNDLPEIIEISIDLGIEKILSFLSRLIADNDPISVLFQLRIYLKELSYSNDQLDYASNRRMMNALNKAIANYDRLIKHPGILDLEFNEMNYLVSKRLRLFDVFKIEKRNEYEVIRSILDWYLIDKFEKEEQCVQLLNKIHYHRLTIEQLDKLINHLPLNRNSEFVKNFIKNQFHIEIKRRINRLVFNDLNGLDKNFYQDLSKYDKIRCLNEQLKQPKTTGKIVASVKQEHKSEEEDNLKNRKQILIKDDFLKNLILLGVCSLTLSKSLPIYYCINERSIMILLGGFKTHLPYSKDQGRLMHHLIRTTDDNSDQTSNEPSILTHDWFPLKDRLPRNLSHFASIRIGHCILVLGGLDLNYLYSSQRLKPISNCYLFNLNTSNWYRLKSMNYSRAYHCAIKYDDNLIYVFGGLTCSTNVLNVTNTMEYYDIVNNRWTIVYDLNQLSVMPSARMAFGMQIVGNQILICGGISNVEDNMNFNSTNLLDDFWTFNLDKKVFKQFKNLSLPCPRAAFGLIKLDMELFVIAGLEISNEFTVRMSLLDDNYADRYVQCNRLENNKREIKAKMDKTVMNTSTVLVCRSDQSTRLDKCRWSFHSKLNRRRVFPLVSRCSDSLLVMGGKQQNHLLLNNVQECSSYEILNRQTSKWFENPIMFASFGSCLIELR